MRRCVAFLAVACLPGLAGAQALYKCTDAKGRVTYQELPCPEVKGQKRLDVSHAGQADWQRAADEQIERRIAEATSEAERQQWRAERERLERDRERQKRERLPAIDEAWNPPWGFPARPGLARPTAPPKPDPGAAK